MYVWKDIHMYIHICLIRIYIATDNSHPLAWYFCEASNEQQTRRRTTNGGERRRDGGCSRGTPQPIAGVAPAPAASLELNGGQRWRNFGFKAGEFVEFVDVLNVLFFSNVFPCPFHFPLIFPEIPGSKNKIARQNKTGKNMFRSCDPLSQNSKESAFTAPMNGWQSGGPEKNGLFSFVLWARFDSTKSKENT